MSCHNKVPGAHGAVGYWGRDMRCHIAQAQTVPKMRALLQDQLLGGGIRAELWMAVHDVRDEDAASPGTVKCTCVKESNQHADRRCASCHGINYVPGYKKFGHETLWAASVSPGLSLTNVQLNTVLKPNRLEIVPSETSGAIETADIPFTRLHPGMLWEWRNDCVVKDPDHTSVDAFFSTDSGSTWNPIENLPSINPTTGQIRFRILLLRASTSNASPAWEILRARFPTIPVRGRLGPWILVLKSVSQQKEIQDPRGIQVDGTPASFWTAPLSFFDCTVNAQPNVDAMLDEADMLRDPAFIQFMDGVNNGRYPQRWTLTGFSFSDPLGYFVRQFFQSRLAQQKEFTWLVW